MEELYSHPGRLLKLHLEGVSRWGEYFMSQSPGMLYSLFEDGLIKDMLLFHDVGKSTMYFQKYLNKEQVKKELKVHSLLSAVLFTWYRLEIGTNDDLNLLAAFTAILYHHTCLKSFEEATESLISEDEILEKQWESIDKEKFYMVLSYCKLKEEALKKLVFLKMSDIIARVEIFLDKASSEWAEHYRKCKGYEEDAISLEYYFKVQILYSLLTDSDKSHIVLENTEIVERCDLNIDIESFLKTEGIGATNTFLNNMRAEAFQKVAKKVKEIRTGKDRIMLLTLPTGMGKTLISFNFAFELRKRLKEETGINYRIIYALPFLSIIDQNARIMEKVLDHGGNNRRILIKHHHLQPYEWTDDEHNEYEPDIAEILIEGWNSEIVITTFVQLFETLVGYLNRRQRKFNKLNNCIVIADELQAIPVQYYSLLRKVILEYVGYCDSYFIAMTATQPAIFSKDEVVNLVNSKKYFANIDRIKLINRASQSMTIAEFADSIHIEENKRYLFILNTIGSARRFFKAMKEKYPTKNICFLSTGVIPIERLERINAIKKDKKYDIVISTQLIEAGVDVDFDVVYRDIAPMPSIIQSAGRANREGLFSGVIIVVKLVDDSGRTFASQIYRGTAQNGIGSSNIDLQETIRIFAGKEEYNEKELGDLVETYYNNICIEGIRSMDVSRELLRGMSRCIFDKCEINGIKPVSNFKLIEDNIEKLPVFVEFDSDAEKLWKEYTGILSDMKMDKWERRSKLINKTKEMAAYIVNVGVRTFTKINKPPEESGFLYVQRSQINCYYDKETGFGSDSSLVF